MQCAVRYICALFTSVGHWLLLTKNKEDLFTRLAREPFELRYVMATDLKATASPKRNVKELFLCN